MHYIPHQAVVKITSNFTKTRIVFNGSARLNKNSYSINCCLELGPDLSANLVGMLLRARFAKILITSDIEKAFLQVSVDISDRDALRFLWLKDHTKPIERDNLLVLRFCRVPFGLKPSPFLLQGVIQLHAKRENTAMGFLIPRMPTWTIFLRTPQARRRHTKFI